MDTAISEAYYLLIQKKEKGVRKNHQRFLLVKELHTQLENTYEVMKIE